MRVLDYIVTISFGYICTLFDLTCPAVVLTFFVMCGCECICGFCNVWVYVCMGFVSVGVLVICILVFSVFCVVCTVFFVLFRLCKFILICFACTSVGTTTTE